ncbi:hypothetical protein BC827DRAFT_1243053, partial [Russula dissimulans]
MASSTSGILRWTSSIRDAMINDPGRQFFEDQVQSQGFLFLEEYLDNIWTAPRQDSFVDLVKTPGRKRASPQKARQAVAGHTTSKGLSDEKDAFQSDNLRLSPPPLTTAIEPRDYAIDLDLPRQIVRSPTTTAIIEQTQVTQQHVPSIPSASSTFVDMSVPLKEEDASASGITRNHSLSQFPSLAAPSPLRKSMRNPRELSLEPSVATTPGSGLTGNHTSWLAKVREAKAIEATNKRASVTASGPVAPSGGLKRKSDGIPSTQSDDSDHSEERKTKILKTGENTTEMADYREPRPPVASAHQLPVANVGATNSADDITALQTNSETDMMAPLKKAIEALRARTGKSLAGNVAEMVAREPSPIDIDAEEVFNDAPPRPHTPRPSLPVLVPIHGAAATAPMHNSTPSESSEQIAELTIAPPVHEKGRLSVSDLITKHDKSNATGRISSDETTISTTPPVSPPATSKTAFFVPGGPVFNKPPPVFVPPPAVKPESSAADGGPDVPKGHLSELPGYSLAAPFGLGLQPMTFSKSPRVLHSVQSTQSSLFSDNVFGSQKGLSQWVPRSQDTQITSQESQPVVEEKEHLADIDDDDDSWPIDDKFAATNQMWTPFSGIAAVEDSMTWSSVPSEGQIGNKSPQQDPTELVGAIDTGSRSNRSHIVDELDDEDMDVGDDMEKEMLETGKPTVNLVMANPDVTKSQLSVASSSGESSQPVGFFGHATKLVSSMLGVNKKAKAEAPKSIQLAAAVAKKQQDEQDRRAARLREMEARRQAVLQKKADEEKVKAEEGERKAREDAERRKKEREENTSKRPPVRAESKLTEDDNTRKRKIIVEAPKVKPPSKEKRDVPVTRITKPGQISGSKTTTVTKQPSTTSLNQATNVKAPPAEKPVVKPAPVSTKGKGKKPAEPEDAQTKKPAQLQTAEHAHAKRHNVEPPIASEMIELPEPNSEYSDSEDEGGQQRKASAPEWTQSPELRAALESQSRVNPDDIFGPVRPLRIEDIFRTRTSRFRARTSSANWSGPDGLKQEEEREYARRMGF